MQQCLSMQWYIELSGYVSSFMFFGVYAWASILGLGWAQLKCFLREAFHDHPIWGCYSIMLQSPWQHYHDLRIYVYLFGSLSITSPALWGLWEEGLCFFAAVCTAHGTVLRHRRGTINATNIRLVCTWRSPALVKGLQSWEAGVVLEQPHCQVFRNS